MKLIVAISTVDDGNMLIHEDKANRHVVSNRKAFLKKNSIDINHTTRVNVTFDTTDFKRYITVADSDKGGGMFDGDNISADALVTKNSHHALFLPLADCVGVVIYDPQSSVLMLTHIGRHSLEQNGAYESVAFLKNTYSSQPGMLQIWLTPSPSKDAYPVFSFDNRALKDVVYEQLLAAGIQRKNITDHTADTATDPHYFSHSAFLKGQKPSDGRYAIVAMMVE